MKALFTFLLLVIGFSALAQTENKPVDAQNMFTYLNACRANPSATGKAISINLNNVKPSVTLQWDSTLAKAAQQKAYEMANENYMAHVDKKGLGMNYRVNALGYTLPDYWLKNKKNNFIESIAANSKGTEDFINQLIIDKGVPDYAHRKHLLGMGEFYSKATHCGIGVAYNPKSKYKYYTCVLIAPKF